MKKLLWIPLFLALSGPAWAQSHLLDQVVAVVNDEAITQSELEMLLRPVYEEYKDQYQGSQLEEKLGEAREKLLKQLVEDRLVFQQAKSQKIQADDAEVEKQLDEFKKHFPNDEAMEEAMQKEGLTLDDMRERLERHSVIRKLQDMEVRAKIVVSPLEVEKYFQGHPGEFVSHEKLKVRSLTLKKNDEARDKGLTDESARKKIEDLRKKILSGEEFGKLAKEYSEDSSSKNEGLGDWIEHGAMIPEIDQALFALKVGEVSQIVETPMGYHLFRVEEKKDGYQKNLDQVRDEIFNKLYAEKAQKRFQEWMDQLKREAYISIR